MRFKYSLILITFLSFIGMGFGQVVIFSEDMGSPSAITTIASNNFQNSGILTYTGTSDVRTTTASTSYTGASGSGNVFFTTSSSVNFEISNINTTGFSSIVLSFGAHKSTLASDMTELVLEYSLDGLTYTTLSFPAQPTGTGTANWRLLSSINLPINAEGVTNLHLRWSSSSSTTEFRLDDITLQGTLDANYAVDWCNLQSPENGSINLGGTHPVYAQVWENGVTNSVGQTPNLLAWIGYSLMDNDPSDPLNASHWTWEPAAFNVDTGNNDEFSLDLGTVITSVGTYYYASRFQYNGGPYQYGGYSNDNGGVIGGFWGETNGSETNRNGELIINARTPDFYNLQYPEDGVINVGDPFLAFAQIYEPGITNLSAPDEQGPNIQAWIGYSLVDNDPSNLANSGDWTWVAADYNSVCSSCDPYSTGSDQNDEYYKDIGASLSVGTYYYASRFTLDDPTVYYYGGFSNYNGAVTGGEWGATNGSEVNRNGILTINPLTCSDLIISEYVEGSSNNKCIEIYNPTSSTINLSNYSLEIYSNGNTTPNGSGLALSGFINSGDTYVICNSSASSSILSLSDLSSSYITFNGNDAIALVHSGVLIDVIGEIGYDPGIEWANAGVSTLDKTIRRDHAVQVGDYNGSDIFDPSDEWSVFPIDDVSDLGYHFSDCIPTGELQLQLPVGIDLSCGSTYNFSNTIIGTNNDVTLRIKNLGGDNLDVTGFSFLTGTEFSIVSAPAVPFTIAPYGFQDITLRFNPSAIGLLLDTLTITSSDASESTCSIDLTGIGESNCATTTVTLFSQDFETLASDTWNYTATHDGTLFPDNWGVNTYLEFPDTSSSISSAQSGSSFWGITDLERPADSHENQPHELSFNANISGNDNVQLSFYYYTIGLDTGDSLEYELFYDGNSQGIVSISDDTGSWTQVLINIPNTVTTLDLLFYADLNARYDLAGIDNIELTSTSTNTATWDGSSWDNIVGPNTTMAAILNGSYNTATDGGSFSACNLIVNSGWVLTIGNGDFVSVENNVVMNGEIYVDRQGALVQVQDTGTFALTNSSAKNTMSKLTAPLQYWYDYTYWSSPLENAQIETALFSSRPSRRFYFDASLFNDDLIETDNTNTFTSGQDDIDDNGDDWVVQSTGTMNPGTGYAATHDNIGFVSGNQYQYIFEGTLANGGAFNTGDIDVDIYIDPSASYNNWNLIGNPYPCAIDALEFFNDNSTLIEGTIYLWSSDSNVDANNSGNQGYNFSQNDYAQINGSGGVASSNGSPIPETYVPSGQGFFVIGKKSGAISGADYYTSTVFNNSMRVTGNNNQFFKTSNVNNKLWINLTSDNGVFNQALIGYFSEAMDDYDGMFYDAPRNLSTGQYALLYSIISDNDTKFSIQGKAQTSLTLDEHIQLGFSTTIDIPSIYTLSIAQLQGNFLTSNTIYLKDNYLNLYHDLSASDYSFTSEPGEFNDRFEIVFQTTTLSINDTVLSPSDLTIIELPDGSVKFKVAKDASISQVEIIDVLGRTLYTLEGSSSEEVYFLPQLHQATYVARVTLDSGQTLTKKAIKR